QVARKGSVDWVPQDCNDLDVRYVGFDSKGGSRIVKVTGRHFADCFVIRNGVKELLVGLQVGDRASVNSLGIGRTSEIGPGSLQRKEIRLLDFGGEVDFRVRLEKVP